MRYTYARFANYIPFYNGLGLYELEIDFSNSFNHIVIISGINGCGKTTLMKLMNLMPDSPNLFIEGLEGEKEFRLVDGETEYHILIRSPITKSGRGATKSSFMKDGVELNPNGNVSSYKEIIFSEFDLNANFAALSQLSSSDRGLADKLPSERKKFMSAIIDSLEVYNDMYKELNKKATIFRSYVNNLHTKIQNIGDEKALSLNLSNLAGRLKQIKMEEDELKEIISTEKAKISIHDPNGDIHDRFLSAEQKMKEEEKTKNRLSLEFERACANIGLPPSMECLESEKDQKEAILTNAEKEITKDNLEIQRLSSLHSSTLMEIEKLRVKIEKMEDEFDPSIQEKCDRYVEKIESLEHLLVIKGLVDRNATVNEIQLIQKYMQKIIDLVDQFYQDSTPSVLEVAVDPECVEKMKRDVEMREECAKRKLSGYQTLLDEQSEDLSKILVLDNRPEHCGIPTCPFIASALSLKEEKYPDRSVTDCIEDTKRLVHGIEHELAVVYDDIVLVRQVTEKSRIFSKIQEVVSDNDSLFYKTTHSSGFSKKCKELLKSGNPLSKYRDLEIYAQISSLLIDINTAEIKLQTYQAERRIQREYATQLYELSKEESELLKKEAEYKEQLTIFTKDLSEYQKISKECQSRINQLANLQTLGQNLEQAKRSYESACKEYEGIKTISVSSIDSFNRLGEARQRLDKIQQDRIAIEPTIASLQGQLSMLDTYKADYILYDKKFKMVDLVRRYTSPSKGGIQSLFIQLYMSKTLQLANQLLQMLFNGEYRLLDFVIDSNEFRIPFVGSGMMVDDISSGSTSQVCIIGSIINLVLLHQASSRYNIAFLDEIDGGLDDYNRTVYGNEYLHKLVSVLGIEQLFVISHSAEVELVNADIIRLRQHDNFNAAAHKGNVIYDYSEEMKKHSSK